MEKQKKSQIKSSEAVKVQCSVKGTISWGISGIDQPIGEELMSFPIRQSCHYTSQTVQHCEILPQLLVNSCSVDFTHG